MLCPSLFSIFQALRYRRGRTTFNIIHASLRDEDRNFLYVWFVLYVLRLWGTLRFILYVTIRPSDDEWYMKVLLRLQALGDPAQAFCNFFLFCLLDKTVFTKIKQAISCVDQENSERLRLLAPESGETNCKQLTSDPFTLNGENIANIQGESPGTA